MFVISFSTFSFRRLSIGSIAYGSGLRFSTSCPEVVNTPYYI